VFFDLFFFANFDYTTIVNLVVTLRVYTCFFSLFFNGYGLT